MKINLLFVFFIFQFITAKSQENKQICVAFYNVENLFDTIDAAYKQDYEHLPDAQKKWNTAKYEKKLHNIARVIAALNDWKGPDLIGLGEVENRQVLEDLVFKTYLNQLGYGIIHKESPDNRGIDVALLYKKSRVKLLDVNFYGIKGFERPTRDILHAACVIEKDTVHYIVSHWPSRYGGRAETDIKRKIVGAQIRSVVDSLYQLDPGVKVIVTGDFNDGPDEESVTEGLGATADSVSLLYNTSVALEQQGKYTHKYKHETSLLDQMVVTNSLMQNSGLTLDVSDVFHPEWLQMKDEKIGGSKPFRTFYGVQYLGGYSDHFPVYIILKIRD